MSSKRVLYKPATTAKVITKEKRKPLAQGRLVAKPSGGVRRTNIPPTLQQGTTNDVLKTTAAYPRSQLQARVALTSPPSTHRRADDAPRRDKPHASMTQSPERAEPSRSLDLSDTESDVMGHITAGSSARDSSIMMIDASRQTLGANTSEVDIEIGHAPSPAKVVCHSPSVVHSRLRNTGDIGEARRVVVDHMPSINVLSYSDYTDPNAPRPVSTFKSPLVVRENTIAGSPIDLHSLSKPTVSKNLFATGHDELKHTQPARSYPQPRDMSVDNLSEASSFDSISDISENSVTSKPVSVTAVQGQKKKPEGTLYPTPRHLHTSTTAVKAKTGPLRATDRTIMGSKDTASNLKPMSARNPCSTSGLKPKVTGKISKYRIITPETKPTRRDPKQSAGDNASRITPKKSVYKLSAQKSGKQSSYTTSTPTGVDEALHPVTTPVETSWQQGRYQLTPEINANKSNQTVKDSSPQLPLTDDSRMSSISTIGSNDSRPHKTQEDVNQLQLDLIYTRYLQYIYFESCARSSLREQEKNVMADLYAMSELVSEKRKRKDELEHQLARMRHVNHVDDALHLQEVGVNPVVSALEQLGKQYHTLATALDTTRHQLPTKGIYIPDNEDQFIDQLQSALNESEQLLGELSVMSRHKQPQVAAFAETVRTLDQTANEQVLELAKCQELLAAATTLTVQECSLLIQDVQLSTS